MKLDSLYQEIILDHYRNPHHRGLREPYDAEVHHVNPTCGDEVTLRVRLADGRVEDVSYDSEGCSISQASASVMSDLVIGRRVEEAMELEREFLAMLQARGAAEPDEDRLEDAVAFAGVAKYPARVKCALLSWMAWKDATARALGGLPPSAPEVNEEELAGMSETGAVATAAVEDVEETMRDVVDPELGINVVDLGLVYGITVHDDNTATLDMTLTSAACPLTDVIEDQARSALLAGPEPLVNDFRINWVWMPPWGPDKITEEGREQLRALGFNV